MSEHQTNRWPMNQAALKWLNPKAADPSSSYLAQLAQWGLERGGAEVSRPVSPSQPDRGEVAQMVEQLVGEDPGSANRWLVQNPNLPTEDQMRNLAAQLSSATSAEEAAQIAVETVYDRMVAESESSPA